MTKRATKRRWKRESEESRGIFRIRRDYRSQQAIVDEFNRLYKPGQQLTLTTDQGRRIVKVWHPAEVLGGHTAVGWFHEITGCYAIAGRVQPLPNTSGPDSKSTIAPTAAALKWSAATNSGDGLDTRG